MKRIAMAGAAGAALLASPAAADDWSDLMDSLMETAVGQFSDEGYHYSGFAHNGALADGESEDVAVRLGPGLEFVLIGACDLDCEDLDLVLYDDNGREVDSDLEMDDFPIVMVSPSRDAVYRIRVTMADCEIEPCRYGIQTFAR